MYHEHTEACFSLSGNEYVLDEKMHLDCLRVALSLQKIGSDSTMKKTSSFPFYCLRLALSLQKIGGGSTIKNEKTSSFPFYCLRLALSLQTKRNNED